MSGIIGGAGSRSGVIGRDPAFGRVVRTAGNLTTTSTSLVDVTGATVTFTTGAFPVAYGVAQAGWNNTINAANRFNVDIDGTLQHGSIGIQVNQPTAGYRVNYSFSGQSVALSAGSHTIKLQWSVNSGTGTLECGSVSSNLFYAHEIR